MGTITDRDLLQQWRLGNESAFGDLVARHRHMVQGVAHRIVSDHHAAEDISQAVFLILARKADALLHGGPELGGWLHRVARDLARNRRSADQARRRHEEAAMIDEEASDSVVGDVLRREFRAQMDDALAMLPERQRASIVLHHLEGLPVAAVAARLCAPEGSVCQWLSRGRERLRRLLERRGVMAGAALPLLLSETAVPLPLTPMQPTATALSLADVYMRQQAVVTTSIAAGCAIAACGVLALACIDFPSKESPMSPRSLVDAAVAATLITAVPALSAADAQVQVDANHGQMTASPAPRILAQGQVATLGEAARLLSSGDLLIRVDQSLQDAPIIWPADGRFVGTPAEIMKKIVFTPGQRAMTFGGSQTKVRDLPPQHTLDIRPHRHQADNALVQPAVF